MNKEKSNKLQKLRDIYGAFHEKMKNIIKRQSDLIEKIVKYSNDKKIENVREKIRNL